MKLTGDNSIETQKTLGEPQPVAVVQRATPARTGKFRVAVVGCGAVAQQFHIPILAGHERVELVALVDRDVPRATTLGRQYGIDRVLADVKELSPDNVDAAVVATPPVHHAPCSIELARRGIHVFVEKPMALHADEAEAMVNAANAAGVVLAVGLFRRLLPTTRLLRAVVDSGILGQPVSFDVDEGAIYGWEAVSLGNMRKELAGGGVLIDVGSHAIDRILHVLPGPAEVLDYLHNARGGIESDCRLRLRIQHHGDDIDGMIQLSRTRRLRNTVRIECERGALEVPAGERFAIDIRPHGVALTDTMQARVRDIKLQLGWADEPKSEWWEIFRAELDDWLQAMTVGKPPQLSGSSALPTVRLIDTCYRQAQPLREPGIDEGLEPASEPSGRSPRGTVGRPATAQSGTVGRLAIARSPSPSAVRRPRVLVTGATGFIGCRVAEILSLREGCEVRAVVHTPANASRLARLPVEMVMGDLGSREDARRLVDSIDAIVHCAIAPPWASRRETRQITVGGTRHLVEASLAAGVGRFVHLSSFGIHGNDVSGTIDELTPVRPPKGDKYCEGKADSERVVLQAASCGLPVVVLRPTNVYGPFSKTFIVRPIEHLARNRLILVGSAEMPSNTIYVDNLVEAIWRSIQMPADIAGEVFLVSDADGMTWGQFYSFFADAIGAQLTTAPAPAIVKRSEWPGRGLWNWSSRWTGACHRILISREFKDLGRKILDTDPVGLWPREMLQRSPRFRAWLRKWLRMEHATVYRRGDEGQADVFSFRSRPAEAVCGKAQRRLGDHAVVSRSEALQRTLNWLRYARIVR